MKQLTCEPLRAEETSQDLGVDTVPVATTMGASRRHVAVEVPNIVVASEDWTAKGAWHGLALDSLLDQNVVCGGQTLSAWRRRTWSRKSLRLAKVKEQPSQVL